MRGAAAAKVDTRGVALLSSAATNKKIDPGQEIADGTRATGHLARANTRCVRSGSRVAACDQVSAIPYLFASIGMIVWARYVGQTGHRLVNLAIACLLGGVGLLAPTLSGSLTVALIGFVALIGVSAARAVFWTVPTRFLTGVAAAGGLAFINSIGAVGGFVGPSMMGWLKEFSGSYAFGLTAVAAIMVASMLASLSLKLVVSNE